MANNFDVASHLPYDPGALLLTGACCGLVALVVFVLQNYPFDDDDKSLLQRRESNRTEATPDDKAERCANADAVIRGRQVELELEVARAKRSQDQPSAKPRIIGNQGMNTNDHVV